MPTKEYYNKNKKKVLRQNKQSYIRNRDKRLSFAKDYRVKNRESINEKAKVNYKKNKIKLNEKAKEYCSKNPEKVVERNKKFYNKNRNKEIQRVKKYQEENRDKVLERKKKYRIENKPKLRKYNNSYSKNRKKNDKSFCIASRLRIRLNKAMRKYTQTGKIMRSKRYGVNYEAIIEHLKPFPRDVSKYHIDHIKPLCSFDLTSLEEIKKAFAPENHQWLLAEDNLKKGGKVI